MEVYLSEIAEQKLTKLTRFLAENWNHQVKTDFLAQFNRKINQISNYPESCPKSMEFGGIYKCVVTKQTTFFYRIHFENEEIEIITLFDTRQNPDMIRGQLE